MVEGHYKLQKPNFNDLELKKRQIGKRNVRKLERVEVSGVFGACILLSGIEGIWYLKVFVACMYRWHLDRFFELWAASIASINFEGFCFNLKNAAKCCSNIKCYLMLN